jgi:hypothetical protein
MAQKCSGIGAQMWAVGHVECGGQLHVWGMHHGLYQHAPHAATGTGNGYTARGHGRGIHGWGL